MNAKLIKRDASVGWLLLFLNLGVLIIAAWQHWIPWIVIASIGLSATAMGLWYNGDMRGMLWMRDTWKLP